MSILIENGADIHATDNAGRTAFLSAVCAGECSCAGALQGAGASVQSRDVHLRSCLHLAVMNERMELLSFLLDKIDAETVDRPDIDGRTALHYAVLSNNEQVRKHGDVTAEIRSI